MMPVPHLLVLDVTTPGAGFAVASSSVVTAIVDGGAEFVVTRAGVTGLNPANTNAGEGVAGQLSESPDGWPAIVQVSEERGGLRLSDAPVRASAMFGNSLRPAVWPVPWVLAPGAEVRIETTQWWNVSTRAFFVLYGYRRDVGSQDGPPWLSMCDPRARRFLAQSDGACPYWLSFRYDELTGRSPVQSEVRHVTISGSTFLGLDMFAGFDDPADGTGFFLQDTGVTEKMQIRNPGVEPALRVSANTMRLALDNGAYRLDDRPVAVASLCGTARRPGRLPVPLILEPGRSVSVTVQFADASSVVDGAVRGFVAMGGVRVFD